MCKKMTLMKYLLVRKCLLNYFCETIHMKKKKNKRKKVIAVIIGFFVFLGFY